MEDRGEHKDIILVRIAAFKEVERALADPVRRMIFLRKLAYLRNVIHLGSLSVEVEYVIIGRIADKIVILILRAGLQNVATLESEVAELIPDVMHLADVAAVVARFGNGRIKSLALIGKLGVVVGVTRSRGVLTRHHRKSRGNTNGRGSHTAGENFRAVQAV